MQGIFLYLFACIVLIRIFSVQLQNGKGIYDRIKSKGKMEEETAVNTHCSRKGEDPEMDLNLVLIYCKLYVFFVCLYNLHVMGNAIRCIPLYNW